MSAQASKAATNKQHCHYHAEYFDACANCADIQKAYEAGRSSMQEDAAQAMNKIADDCIRAGMSDNEYKYAAAAIRALKP